MKEYNFYRALHARGLTQARLAKLAGVGRSHLCQVIAGTRSGEHTWHRIVEHLTREEAGMLGREGLWDEVAENDRLAAEGMAQCRGKCGTCSTENIIPYGTKNAAELVRLVIKVAHRRGDAPVLQQAREVLHYMKTGRYTEVSNENLQCR